MGMDQRDYLWWMVLPVLPFLLAVGTLQALSGAGIDLVSSQLPPEVRHTAQTDLRFASGIMIYASVALFHSVICLGVIGYSVLLLMRRSPHSQKRSVGVLAGSMGLVVLANLGARDFLIGALDLTYRTNCNALVTLGAGKHLLPDACDSGPLSLLAVLALTPYVLGILAAAMTSALTATAYDSAESEPDLLAGAAQVDRMFQATAFVLATSVATLVAFYRLPLALISDETVRDLVAGFGQGMAMFWGVGFTLTLLAIFAPSTLLVQRRLALYRDAGDLPTLRAKLADQGPRKRVQDALTLLAPLLVGSAATIIDLLAKALE